MPSIVRNHAATGGGVYNGGAFTLSESASITDNTANYGGGVANMGTFNMTGSAAITGNAATEAGGGLYHAGSAITLSGDIALSGNTGGDIHLLEISPENKHVLNISGALTNADPIGVSYAVLEGTLPDTIPFTQGLSGNGGAANFKSASDDYRVRVNADGEAELYALTFYTVTFDADNGDDATIQRVAEGETAARPNDPTKEGHRFLGWYADGATEAFDFNTALTGDITLTAHWQKVCAVIINADAGCIVTVTADYSEENGGTPVASGDVVDEGTVLTVTARAKAGYSLMTTPEASYTVNDDLTITAASEALTYTLTLTHENGAAPTFTGTDSLTAVPYGAKVTVMAGEANEGFEFVGWYQTNGVQLVTDNTMTITVTGNSEYLARYQEKSCVVTFMANGQSIKTMTSAASITEADLPTNANEYACTGYVFTGWDKTVSEINVALGNGNNVTVTANYAPKPADITVTVYNGNSETPTTQTLTESKYISITAETVEGMVLAYWTMDDEIVTYNKKCTVLVTRDCTLRAVYSTEATEAIGTATIQTVNYNADAKKLTFVAYLTVPDGCKITAMGIVANNAEAGNDPKYGSATFTKDYAKSHGTSIPWTYTWNKTNVSIGDIWYARAYVFYNDTNGTNHEVYGSLITTNAGTNYDYTEKGTAKIIGTSYNADAKKASFVAYLNIPEGGVISKAGLVASSSVNYNPSSNGMLIADNAQYVKAYAKATGTSIPWTYTWNKTNVNSGDIWYARAYLVYTLNGIERTSSTTSPSNTGSPTSLRTWISPRRTARRCSPSMSCPTVPQAFTRSI